jgi:1-phosphofructokinase
MIYTVTFNPALDYIVRLDSFTAGEINRMQYEQIMPGGKGINVSIVLNNLGIENRALGFIAGFTGKEIEHQLTATGCKSDFIELPAGNSRINVKIKADKETEINGQGPNIPPEFLERLLKKMDELQEDDILVLAGSIPSTLPDDIYQRILKRLDGKGIRVVVDATCNLLLNVLKYKPFLIKPNNHELGEMFGIVLKSDEEIILHAKKLQERGAQNVLISMAGDGAILLTADGSVFRCAAPKGQLVNSVGAGDSMVAGFLTGYIESHSFLKAFHMGVATGSASAFSENLATRAEVETLLKTIH